MKEQREKIERKGKREKLNTEAQRYRETISGFLRELCVFVVIRSFGERKNGRAAIAVRLKGKLRMWTYDLVGRMGIHGCFLCTVRIINRKPIPQPSRFSSLPVYAGINRNAFCQISASSLNSSLPIAPTNICGSTGRQAYSTRSSRECT
jgi:hypothetical protein